MGDDVLIRVDEDGDDPWEGSFDQYMDDVLPKLLDGRLVDYGWGGQGADVKEGPWRMIPQDARTKVRTLFPVDVAQAMREGVEPPEMLVDDWLVKGELHWVSAQKETAKTWLALTLCVAVMDAGGTVAYFDEELGLAEITRRLVALGADPDIVQERFGYFPFSEFAMSDEAAHAILLAYLRPDLAVYDTATDFLTRAGVDENSGREVTAWIKAFPEQGRRLGVTQLVLDHEGHASAGRSVGSRAKGAKAKVEWSLKRRKRFDRNVIGEVKVELAKNTVGAHLPSERNFAVGGDGAGNFVWRETAISLADVDEAGLRVAIRDAIEAALKGSDERGLSKTQVRERVKGRAEDVGKALTMMAQSDLYPHVELFQGSGGHDRYRWTGPREGETE